MPNNNPVTATFAPVPMTLVKEWRTAYRIALANAFFFLILALSMFLLEPTSLTTILSAPALFTVGALLSFLLMVRSGGACAAISWFVLGSGIFFGIGVVIGGVHPNPVSAHSVSHTILLRDLIRVNLLNASSVFIVLSVAYPLANTRRLGAASLVAPSENAVRIMLRIFPIVVAVSAIAVGLKYVLFPLAENLVLRSVASAFYLAIPFCMFLLGMLWRSLGWHLRLVAASVLIFEIINGLLNFNKLQIISALLALLIGTWVSRHSIRYIATTMVMVAAVFVILNQIVNSGRAHINYNPTVNSVVTRIEILSDVVYGSSKIFGSGSAEPAKSIITPLVSVPADTTVGSGSAEPVKSIITRGVAPSLTRLSVPFIQGYLIDEYNNGRAGKSLDDFWAAMIPRVLWPTKPIITRFGPELYAQYYKQHPPTSALAPTYSAEAYWNYGIIGVVLVSILLGLEFGWLTLRSQLALAGQDPVFFLIAAPVAVWAIQVEAWVAATYIGGFLIFFVIWLVARLGISVLLTRLGKL